MSQTAAIAYALSVLCETDPAPACVFYGTPEQAPGPARIVIVPSGFFEPGSYGHAASLPALPLARLGDHPVLFGRPEVERRTGRHGAPIMVVHADIVASAYFLLTRYEEWVRRDVRDEHGRFPGRESLPFRAGFLDRPIIDDYAALLREWAAELGAELPRPNRRFSVLLTHDVDTLGVEHGALRAVRRLGAGCLGRAPFATSLRDAAVACRLLRHPFDNLHDVQRMDRAIVARGGADRCRVVYFFMAGGADAHDRTYALNGRLARSALRSVRDSGGEIGLHASYSAGASPSRIVTERQALEAAAAQSVGKNRHHFLGWREPEDGAAIAAAGIAWDATLGYADTAGFRLGVCRPVPLFDPVRRCRLPIEEHPLLVMDCSLDRPRYMHLDEAAAFAHVRRLADATQRHAGEFVCLWHNTSLASTDTSYHKRLYARTLDYLAGLLEKA